MTLSNINIVFLPKYLEHKFWSPLSVVEFVDEYNDEFDTTFLENLSQDGLTTLKLFTVHLFTQHLKCLRNGTFTAVKKI